MRRGMDKRTFAELGIRCRIRLYATIGKHGE
jgi:hypothetical protein